MSNSVVDYIRQQNPEENRSDEELTLLVGDHAPGQYDGYSDFKAQYDALKASREQAAAPSVTERIGKYGQQVAGSLIRGVAGGFADIPESVATAQRGLQQKFPYAAPLIGQVVEGPLSIASSITGLQKGYQSNADIPLEELPLTRIGHAITSAGESISPAPVPGLEESFWASKLPQGFASTGVFLAGGAAAKIAKVPGWIGIAGLGALSQGVQGYKEAKQAGASDDDAFYSYFLNSIVGTSEVAGLGSILKRIDKWAGGGIKKALLESTKEGFENALQEWLQQRAGNEIAKNIVKYDKDREDFKDVLTNTEVGGITGVVVSLLASAVGAKLHQLKTKQPEKVAKVEEVIPGLTGTGNVTKPEVPTPTVAENYTGPMTPERQDLFARIAAAKIESGVDMSGGLPPEDQLAVRLIEKQMREAATDQQGQQDLSNWRALGIPELTAQRSIMVAQGFDPAQIDAISQVIAQKGGEQNAQNQIQETGSVSIVRQGEPIVAQPEVKIEAGTPLGSSQGAQVAAPGLQPGDTIVSPQGQEIVLREISPEETARGVFTPEGSFFQIDTAQLLNQGWQLKSPAAVEPAPVAPDMAALARTSAVEGLRQEEPPTEPTPAEPAPAPTVPVSEEQSIVSQTPAIVSETAPVVSPPTPVVPSLVDQIGFDNSVFRARPTETTAIGKKGGEAVVIQPAYHDRMASEGYTPALAVQLVQNASPQNGNKNKQNTHRLTAFENTEPDEKIPGHASVVVLGTFQVGGKEVSVVNPDDKRGHGMPLKEFLEQKNSEGSQLWVPLASMWVKETKNGFSQRFDDTTAFLNEVGKPAKEALASNARNVVAMEQKMQDQGITGEGEVFEKATDASYTPKDMSNEFRDVIVEWLPRDKAGVVNPNLGISGIQEVLLSAFEATDEQGTLINADVKRYALADAIEELKGDQRFQKLIQVADQERALLRYIVEKVYAKYKEGGFAEEKTFIQQGGVGQGAEQGVRSNLLPQTGTGQLQAVAQDTTSGAPISGRNTTGDSGIRYSAVTYEDAALTPFRKATQPRPELEKGPWKELLNSHEVDDYLYTLNGLALQGVDVRVVGALVDQLGNQLHGLYDNARKLVVLAVRDVQNPTRENLLGSLEEAFHAAFAGESESTKRRMEAAFAGLERTFLTAPGVNVDQVQAEEALAKVVADNLAAQGIQQPQNWAQRIMAILRELYLRISLAIQQGLFGSQHTRQELAVAYMQSRLSRFLSGQNLHPSFLEFVGGGKPTPAVQAGFYTNANGGGWVNEYYNPDTEQLERPEALENSRAAVVYNHIPGVRYKAVEHVTDPTTSSLEPAVVAVKIAQQNELNDLWKKNYDEWTQHGHNPSGLSFDQWKADHLKVDPMTIIADQNGIMAANNKTPVDPATTVAMLPAESSKKQAINNVRMMAAEQRTAWATRRIADELTVNQNAVALPKSITKLMDLLARWTSKDAMAKATAEKTAEMVKEFKGDIRDIGKLASKSGLLKQVISGIEENLDEPIMRQYEAAVERMFKRFVTDTKGEKLVDLLEVASKLNIDWRNATAKEIRNTLELSAVANPKLEAFIGKDFDSRALFSIAIAFAKSNASVVEFLETKLASTEAERTMVNGALKIAISDTADAIDKARASIKGATPSLAVQADRLLTKLNEAKQANRKLINESKRAKEFIDFHQDTIPVMASEMAKLETAIGAMNEAWEAIDGAEIEVAPNLNSTLDDVLKNKKTVSLKKNGTTSADAREWVAANEAWLAAQPIDERGADWATLDRKTKKLGYIDAKLAHELIIKPGLYNRMLGAIQDRLDYIGLPSTRSAAQRLRRKNYLKETNVPFEQVEGVKVDAAKTRAMDATGWKSTQDDFKKRFYNAILGYREKRKGDLAANSDRAKAIEQTWAATYTYLSSDPEMAAMISKPGAWEAIRKWVDLASANNNRVNKLKSSQEFGSKVEDEGLSERSKILRDAIGDPAYDWPRRVGQWMGSIIHGMREAWGGTATLPLTKKSVAEAHQQNEAALKQALAPRFTPEVWNGWVKWNAYRPGRSLFYAPEVGGVNPMARFAKEAFDMSPIGDIVEFAKNLYRLEGGTSDLSTFIGETLSTFQAQYSALASVFNEENQTNPNGPPVPARVIGDARQSEDFPSEFMDYNEFGSVEMRHAVELLSFEAAFGKNMAGIESDFTTAENQLKLQVQEFDKLKSIASRETLEKGKSQRAYREKLKAEAEKSGGPKHLVRLENAERNLLTLKSQHNQVHLMISMENGLPPEQRSWFEMISTAAFAVVQRGGTALVDLITPFETPFRLMGINLPAFKRIARSGKFGVSETAASLFQTMGVEFHMQAEHAKQIAETGLGDPDSTVQLKDRFISALRTAPVNTFFENPYLKPIETGAVRVSRAVRTLLSSGIGRAKPGSKLQTATFNPLAVFSFESKVVHTSETIGTWGSFQDLVLKGRDFYASNPAKAADIRNHRFTPKELGYEKYFKGVINAEQAFKYLNHKLGDLGMNLEALARRALTNPGQPIFTKEEYKRLSALVRSDGMTEANETNLSAGFFTNPVLYLSKPLVGWGIAKTGAFLKMFREPTGEHSWDALKGGLIVTFLATVPIGLAFAFLRDLWDEKVVGKKANVAEFGQGNDFNAMIDKLARVGTFGEISSPINAFLNQDINRPFSVDSRVFFLSSLFNTVRALGTWGRQGVATYATVYRPLASSLGGGGFLDTIDILNNLTGADNAESRVVARINVNNYLRAVGREMNLEVRPSSGGPALSNAIKPHVSNMLLAALANDYAAFKDAYDKAVEASRDEGFPDPVDHVKRSFASYHPLRTVFKTPPSELEYQGILSALNPRGQQDVAQAVDLFNRYAEILGIKEFDGRKEKPPAKERVTSSQARANAALGLRDAGIFAR